MQKSFHLASYHKFCLLLLGVGLSACTVITLNDQVIDRTLWGLWDEHRQAVIQLEAWTVQASMAVNSAQENFDARLFWRYQQPQEYQLRLNAPGGQGAALIRVTPDGAILRTAQGKTHHADTADALFTQYTALELPVQILSYWIRGLPGPEASVSALRVYPDGTLQAFQQQGWQVRYAEYQTAHGQLLPKRITLENETYLVKLAIQRWNLP